MGRPGVRRGGPYRLQEWTQIALCVPFLINA